jgi:hypothetical protein
MVKTIKQNVQKATVNANLAANVVRQPKLPVDPVAPISKAQKAKKKKGKRVAGNKPKQEFLLAEVRHTEFFVMIIAKLIAKSAKTAMYQNPKSTEVDAGELVRSTFVVYDNLIRHHGVKAGSKLWKEFRNYTLRQARGQPLTELSVITATGRKDRVISKFNNLRPLIFASRDGCAYAYQALNSILYGSRLDVRLPDTKKYSLDDVLYQYKCNPDAVEKYRVWLRHKLDTGVFIKPDVPKGKFQFTIPLTSASPGGGTNLNTLEDQAYDLFKSGLFNSFRNLAEHLGDQNLPKYIQSLAEKHAAEFPKKEAKPVRRITRVPDSDVKDRIIAVVDWSSQLLAGRIQCVLYEFLKKNLLQHTDIFDHAKGAIKVLSDDPQLTTFTSPGKEYILKCTDFDAWTWKFSKEPQVVFMEEVLGKGVSDPFTPLVLDCEWSADTVKTGFQSVKAGSGQAMGSKASFILATVTSITLIQAACEGVFDDFLPDEHRKVLVDDGNFGVPCKAVFSETGDDIVMYDFHHRIESCLLLFGNTINSSKSVYSTDYPAGEVFRFTEYLSRVSMNRKECSRVSLTLCRLAKSHFSYAPHLLSHLMERSDCELNINDFTKVWTKNSGPTQDKDGVLWTENLKSILTLSNPTKVPHDRLRELGFLNLEYTENYIKTFPVRECLLLTSELLEKMQSTATDLKSNIDLLHVINNTIVNTTFSCSDRPLYVKEKSVSALDIYWCEYLERTGSIIANIKRFVHSRSVGKAKKPIMSPYILPRFMNEENLNETLLSLNTEDSKEELEMIVRLLATESRSVDGSYPTLSDRSKHYASYSSLTIRAIRAEGLSFERLDTQVALQLEPPKAVHRTGLDSDSVLSTSLEVDATHVSTDD